MQKDSRTYTILIVEDNMGDFILVEEYLDEMILSPVIHRAESFEQAHHLLSENSALIDVILLDLSLPDKSGEALINEVLTLSKNTPIIILSGYTDVTFSIRSLSLGVSDYLLKDNLNPTTLYKSIIYNIERNKNLIRIKESEQRYADLFHLSPQPMCVYDLETLSFLDVNESAIAHYGYSLKEFLSMTIKDLHVTKNLCDKTNTAEMTENSSQAYYYQKESVHLKKNGELINVDIRSNTIFYRGKKAAIILINDITEHLIHVNAIEQQNEKLREISWLQSHIVRAPLSRMIGLIRMMIDCELTSEEKAKCLSHVLNSANELDQIVKDVVKKAKQINITNHIKP